MRRFFNFILSKARSARVVAKIAFRNLVRQFRRNLLLGIGIAVSMCILVITASFTNGLTDILFNRVMVYMTGHIRVIQDSYVTRRSDVIRDTPRFIETIKRTVPGIKRIDVTISAFGRSIGNGKTGMCALVGIPRDADFYKDTNLEAGHVEDIFKPDVFPGIIMYKNAAKDINVKLNDIVTVRFETVYGQSQAPKFKVVGLIPSENMFMDVAAFVDQDTLRQMLNLKPDESLGLNIVTDYPEDQRKVIQEANKLHAALAPEAAGVNALFVSGDKRAVGSAFALKLDDTTGYQVAQDNLQFTKGDLRSLALAKDGIILTQTLAEQLGADVGARVTYNYAAKSSTDTVEKELVVKGIVKTPSPFADATAFANPEVFYQTYYWNIPRQPATVAHDAPLFKALLPEWDLMARSPNTDAAVKKRQLLGRESWKGSKVDVQTMFENASAIVDFQRGLNTVSLVAVLVLFFVILIGVVNTMRMSIRERTREIGTNRAIGMQRGDVRNVFVLEIVFLAILSCVIGILLAWGVVSLLGLLTFDLKDNPFSMFFVQKHLYFVPKASTIIVNFITIVLVAFLIAFFTARRAAKMRVADALRHYE
ncbi:MAG: FtsX-like permease family protein [Spirochaetia bacterium]|jgi:ABC-type lipoprotein release transport system permease subunit